MHRDRALRAADRDVDVQAEYELAARDARVLRGELPIAGRAVQLAERGGERMRAGSRDQRTAVERGEQVAARGAQHLRGVADGATGRRHRLDLRGDELGLEAAVARERRERQLDARREVQRARIEQHELLLDPDRGGARGVEDGTQRLRVERGSGEVDGRLEGHVCG